MRKHYYVDRQRHYRLADNFGRVAIVTKSRKDGKVYGWRADIAGELVVFRDLETAFAVLRSKGYVL